MLRRGLIAGSAVAAWLAYSQARRSHDEESVGKAEHRHVEKNGALTSGAMPRWPLIAAGLTALASAPSTSVQGFSPKLRLPTRAIQPGFEGSALDAVKRDWTETKVSCYSLVSYLDRRPSKAERDDARAIVLTAMEEAKKLLAAASKEFSEKFPKWEEVVKELLDDKEEEMEKKNERAQDRGERGDSKETMKLLLDADYNIEMLARVAYEYGRLEADVRNQPMQNQLPSKSKLVLRIKLALEYWKEQDPFLVDDAYVGKETQEAQKLLAAATGDSRFSKKFKLRLWFALIKKRNDKLFLAGMLGELLAEYEKEDNSQVGWSRDVKAQRKVERKWADTVRRAVIRSLPAMQ